MELHRRDDIGLEVSVVRDIREKELVIIHRCGLCVLAVVHCGEWGVRVAM